MNPRMIEALAVQRTRELRQLAHQDRRPGVRPARGALRYRAGWALVAIGLRLASTEPARR
jgi:hypothetical protein